MSDPLDDINSLMLEAGDLGGIVSQHPDPVEPKRPKHSRGHAIIALVVGKAEPTVGVDRVEPAILQRIGPELVGEANAAPFLAKVEQDPAALRSENSERFLELRTAVAFETSEHIASEAFAMQSDQGRLSAERTDHQRHVLLAAGRIAEG